MAKMPVSGWFSMIVLLAFTADSLPTLWTVTTRADQRAVAVQLGV